MPQPEDDLPHLLKILAALLAFVVSLATVAVLVINVLAARRLSGTYDVAPAPIAIPTDPEALERGRRLTDAVLCTECHGDDLGGRMYLEAPGIIGHLAATNLTRGQGGVGDDFTDTDWIRALRHGVGPDARSLLITPAQHYYYLSDGDLAAIIAYVKSVPPVDNELPPSSLGPLGRVVLFFSPTWLPAERIDHRGPRPSTPSPGVTADYGEYLVRATACGVCHQGSNGLSFDVAGWTGEEFIRAMRTGLLPDGHRMDPSAMPWPKIGKLTDQELKAIWLYFQVLGLTRHAESR